MGTTFTKIGIYYNNINDILTDQPRATRSHMRAFDASGPAPPYPSSSMSGLPCPPGFNPQTWIQIPELAQVQIWRDTAARTQPNHPPYEPQIDPALLGPNLDGSSRPGAVQRRIHDANRDGPHGPMPSMGNEAIPRSTVE
jgi:hypothetical protein